jgi:hypothetical protein
MIVRFKNTFRDILAFCFYHYPRSPMILACWAFPFALLSMASYQAIPKDLSAVGKVLAFLFLECSWFAVLCLAFAVLIVLSMISRRNKTMLVENTMTLGEDGFMVETPYGRAESKWAIVQKLARTKKYVFIYIAQHLAHVVPRRAFKDDGEWEGFYDFCRRHANPR